jgi:hypothetical protein
MQTPEDIFKAIQRIMDEFDAKINQVKTKEE